jgi:hypothetical protein
MRKFNFNYGSFILAALISLGSAGSAHAAGFALIEMNANGQGNAYALAPRPIRRTRRRFISIPRG